MNIGASPKSEIYLFNDRAMKRFLTRLSLAFVATAATGYVLGPYIDVLPPVCLFRMLTGRRCIFCGMSHAVAYAVRGDFARAGAAHPAWFIVLPLFVVLLVAGATKPARLSWSIAAALALGTLWTAMGS